MGRKTFESLGKILPNRKHIILTRNKNIQIENENVKVITDISELKGYIESQEENFVIGGASIYKMLMPYANKMYITKIHEKFEGDTYFPEINETEWNIAKKEEGITDEKNIYKFEYINYQRKK